MSYIRKTWKFQNAIEVAEYHTGKYGAPGMRRQKKKKATPEQIEKINHRNKVRTCRHKLRTYFNERDHLVDLTYQKDARPPDMESAKQDFRIFIRKVRREYAKRGEVLRWMRNIEVGSKGGFHIHIVINRIPDTDIILSDAWEHGRIHIKPMYTDGEFGKLAAYITKTPKTDRRLREAHYSASRNMPIEKPKEKPVRWKHWGKIRIPNGWYLYQDEYHEGINPVTGYPYRIYTLLRVRRE